MIEEVIAGDARSLARLLEGIGQDTIVSVDTEFMRETTYYPTLCLVQIATDHIVGCVDCIGGFELEPLFERLARPDCTWLVHSARQDLEAVRPFMSGPPPTLLDTQVAAALLGFPPQIGLQDLVTEILGIKLDKTHTRTDWSARPLPAVALRYALDDARVLPALWSALRARLVAKDRLGWLMEDCERLRGEALAIDTLGLWLRLRGARALTGAQQCAAFALLGWRERAAQKADRPRRWIMSDALLLDVASALPNDLNELKGVRGMPLRLAQRAGRDILSALETRHDPDLRARLAELAGRERPDRERLRDLKAVVQARAAELGIHSEILATRRDLEEIAAGGSSARHRAGWRAEILRAELGSDASA